MTTAILFHHAQGLTAGVVALAGRLREAGHDIHLPDLYDGNTFATLDEGIAYAKTVGFGAIEEAGVAAAAGLGPGVVYIGVSLGVSPAQRLAQTGSSAAGAVFISACFPVDEYGESWPAGVPVQVHGTTEDEFFTQEGDLDAARELVGGTDDGELFLYEGSAHLFCDASLDSYDAVATDLLVERTLELLARSTG